MSIFGGKQKSTSTSNSTQTPTFPDWLDSSLQNQSSIATSLYNTPYQQYSGQRVADFTPDEQASFNLTRGLIGQQQPAMNTAQNALGEVTQRGLNGFDQATLNQYMNPYIQNVMDASRQRQYQDYDLQKNKLQQQQSQIGAFGGSRSALAMGQLHDNFSRQLSENEANQLYQGYSDSQNRAMSGTQMAGNAGLQLGNLAATNQQLGLAQAGALSAQGGQQRGLAQAGLDTGYQDFLTQQAYPYQQAQYYQGLINPLAQLERGEKGQSTTTNTSSSSPGIGQIALGLGSMAMGMPGLGMGSMMGGTGMMSSFASGLGNMFSQGGFGGGFGASQDLNSLIGQGLGRTFRHGGQVPFSNTMSSFGRRVHPHEYGSYKSGGRVASMDYEENDRPSLNIKERVDGFADVLHRAIHGDDSTSKPSAMDYEQNDIGGLVKHYDTGGSVFGDIGNGSNSDWGFGSGDIGKWLMDNQTASGFLDSSLAQHVGQHPLESFIDAGSLATVGGPAAISGLKLGYKGLAGLAAMIAKNPSLAAKIGLVGTSLFNHADWNGDKGQPAQDQNQVQQQGLPQGLPQGQTTDEDPMGSFQNAVMHINGGPSPATGDLGMGLPMDGSKQVDMDMSPEHQAALDNIMGTLTGKKDTSTPVAAATLPKQEEMNLPLIAFGAKMLGSDGNFWKSLGESATAYVDTKGKVEKSNRDDIMDKAKLGMDQQKTNAYSAQVLAQIAKASDPYSKRLNKLKADLLSQKISQGNLPAMAKDIFKSITTNNPMLLQTPEGVAQATKDAQKIALTLAVSNNLDKSNAPDDISQLSDQDLMQLIQPPQ